MSGTLARSGEAVSSSPGLHPSADAGVWVTGRHASNSHYSLLVLRGFFFKGRAGRRCHVLCPGCGCAAALMKTSALSKGVAEQQTGS